MLVSECYSNTDYSTNPDIDHESEVRSPVERRIRGGTKADIKNHSYRVGVQISFHKAGSRYEYFQTWCSGAILNEWWIITTASCLFLYNDTHDYYLPARLRVVFGTIDIKPTEEFIENSDPIYTLKHTRLGHFSIAHPALAWRIEYDDDGDDRGEIYIPDNDIGLLKLVDRLKMGPNVTKISLPEFNDNIEMGKNYTFGGWGAVKPGQRGFKLKEINLTVVKHGFCIQRYHSDYEIYTDRKFCAMSDTSDPCAYDEGGALVGHREVKQESKIRKELVIYGVLSYLKYGSVICGEKINPSTFTRVSFYELWIREMMKRWTNTNPLGLQATITP